MKLSGMKAVGVLFLILFQFGCSHPMSSQHGSSTEKALMLAESILRNDPWNKEFFSRIGESYTNFYEKCETILLAACIPTNAVEFREHVWDSLDDRLKEVEVNHVIRSLAQIYVSEYGYDDLKELAMAAEGVEIDIDLAAKANATEKWLEVYQENMIQRIKQLEEPLERLRQEVIEKGQSFEKEAAGELFYECRSNKLYYVDLADLRVRVGKAFDRIKSECGTDPLCLIQCLQEAKVCDDNYCVDLTYGLIAQLVLYPAEDSDSVPLMTHDDTEKWMNFLTTKWAMERRKLTFLVRESGSNVFERARSIAEDAGIPVLYSPLAETNRLKFVHDVNVKIPRGLDVDR